MSANRKIFLTISELTRPSDHDDAPLHEMAVCNIEIWRSPQTQLLPFAQLNWLQDHSEHVRKTRNLVVNRETGMDARVAGKAAQHAFEQPYEQEVLEYWVEGSFKYVQ